jgi:hypothetical protein
VEGLPNVGELIQTVNFTLVFVSAGSLFVRRLRASGVERQQLKWFTYTSTLAISGTILTYTISEALGAQWLKWAGYALMQVGLVGVPISMGIAILRYRLYDIDIIINRTLVYGSLTVLLVLVYFGGVTATQTLFRYLTGQEQQPQLAVVVSTLAIAALFTPMRRRIQSFIDRRFFRRKYDAKKTSEAFSAKLRDETDLRALNGELVGVVMETMQPAHVSLWLHPDTTSESEQAR